jgi:serine/threonine-protein kinase
MLTRIGKYQIVAKIGAGAMGEVYRAHDPVLFRDVAIKTISAALASDPELRRRFHREAQSAARLNHPNIVTVYDFGDEQGQLYMAMELLEGTDLRDLIARRALCSLDEKLKILEQIAEGLAFAHAKEVIHRDLKPANVQVQPAGRVKIMDFGLARLAATDMTRAGTIMGTPHYMSPEQVRGERADARSDVFSLGVVVYEVLTGTRPFHADSMAGVMVQVTDTEPVPIATLAPDLPAAIVALVERALAKDPERRYVNAGALRDALRAARGSLPAPSRQAGTLQAAAAAGTAPTVVAAGPTVVDAGRARRARGVAAVAIVGAGLAAWLVWWPGSSPPSATPPPADPQNSELTRALVAQRLELARRDMKGRDFKGALAQAERALALDAANAEARQLAEAATLALAAGEASPAPRAAAAPGTLPPSASRAAPRPTPPTAVARAPRDAAADAPARAAPVPGTPAPTPLPPPVTVAAAPPPAPAAPPPQARGDEWVRRALDDYEAAFASLDPAAVKRVYPGIDRQFLDNLRNFRAYDMDLQVKQITVEGDRARVLCTRTVVFKTFANTTRSLRPADEELVFERRGDSTVRIQ